MRVLVIIVSYNTRDLLRECLRSLPPGLAVFVVDNASQDGSAEMVATEFPEVNLVRNTENQGFAAAVNQGYREADYILLLNPDARLRPGALDRAIEFMEANPKVGICGGLMYNPQGGIEPSARRFPNAIYKLFQMSGLSDRHPNSKIFGRADYKYFAHDKPLKCDWVPGTCVLLRGKMVEEIGLFDERFYLYFEEVDLCNRAKRKKWEVYFLPGLEYEHTGGASAKARCEMKFDPAGRQLLEFRMRAEWLYLRKHRGIHSVVINAKVEYLWHLGRYLANIRQKEKRDESKQIMAHIWRSLKDTNFGRCSPQRPW